MSKRNGEYFVEGAPKIDAVTAKELHDRGVRFVDVRSAVAYGRGHIPGAHLRDVVITLSKETLSEVADPDAEVVFYCYGRYCPMSTFAVRQGTEVGLFQGILLRRRIPCMGGQRLSGGSRINPAVGSRSATRPPVMPLMPGCPLR